MLKIHFKKELLNIIFKTDFIKELFHINYYI